MRRNLRIGALIFLLAVPGLFLQALNVYPQGVRIPGLPEDTSPAYDDLVITVDDPLGTPASKKVSFVNLSKPLGWIDSQSYTSLSAADAAACNAGKLLLITTNYTLAASTTLRAKIHVAYGGGFTKASTFTLAFGDHFNAGRYKVFNGFSTRDVTFGQGSIEEVYPEWWGAKADGTTDNSTIFPLIPANSKVSLSKGTYYFNAPTNINCDLIGCNRNETSLALDSLGNLIVNQGGLRWSGLTIRALSDSITMITVKQRRFRFTDFHLVGNLSFRSLTGFNFDTTSNGITHCGLNDFQIESVTYPFHVGGSNYFNNNKIGDWSSCYITDFKNAFTIASSVIAMNINFVGGYFETNLAGDKNIIYTKIAISGNIFFIHGDCATGTLSYFRSDVDQTTERNLWICPNIGGTSYMRFLATGTNAAYQNLLVNPSPNFAKLSKVLSDVTQTGSTGETIVSSYYVQRNYFSTSNGARITAAGTASGTNDYKYIRLKFGASGSSSQITLLTLNPSDAGSWLIECTIYNTATNAQRFVAKTYKSGAFQAVNYGTLSVDTTVDNYFAITVNLASANDSVTVSMFTAEGL